MLKNQHFYVKEKYIKIQYIITKLIITNITSLPYNVYENKIYFDYIILSFYKTN